MALKKKQNNKKPIRKKKQPTKKVSVSAERDTSITLDDVIVSLQKTFSRVSSRTGKIPELDAQATITGTVKFELGIKVNPDSDHALRPDPQGSIDLLLSGDIETDVRYETEE